uniref:Uncharacterized protein n=1 Tax=Cannabis sativa TaxID=3483 RepID=A0A803QDM8_CANSA
MSVVRKVEIANDMHIAPLSGQIVEVKALKNLLAYRLAGETAPFTVELLDQVAGSALELPTEAALLAESTTAEVDALVTELDQQLEEESARQSRLIRNMKAIHDLYMETVGRMSGVGPSSASGGVQP